MISPRYLIAPALILIGAGTLIWSSINRSNRDIALSYQCGVLAGTDLITAGHVAGGVHEFDWCRSYRIEIAESSKAIFPTLDRIAAMYGNQP